MEDGTTAFAMALASQNLELIRILLASNHPCDIDPRGLAERAIDELERTNTFPSLRSVLVMGLGSLGKQSQKAEDQQDVVISKQ